MSNNKEPFKGIKAVKIVTGRILRIENSLKRHLKRYKPYAVAANFSMWGLKS